MNAAALRKSLARRPIATDPQFVEDIQYLERLRDSFTQEGHLDRAIEVREKIKNMRAQAAKQRITEEESRQQQEEKLFDIGVEKLRSALEEEWKQKIEAVDKECAQKLEAMQQVHQREIFCLENDLRQRFSPTPKFSKELLALRSSKDKLLALQRYEEVMKIEKRVAEMERRETVNFQVAVAEQVKQRMQQLKDKQAAEWSALERTLQSRKLKIQRDHQNALQRFEQTKRNLFEDMRHVHKMEFHSKPEPQKSLQNARKSYTDQSSTFRGTLLYAKTTQSKVTVPSLDM